MAAQVSQQVHDTLTSTRDAFVANAQSSRDQEAAARTAAEFFEALAAGYDAVLGDVEVASP